MRITVFTPTFNRAYIIHKLYESLKQQSNYDFEWLVIDDGSNDLTEELFRQWTNEENKFSIRYFKKKNGGKHRAINIGTELAKGELFFIVDSDDNLSEDAIASLCNWDESVTNEEKKYYCAISGNKGKNKNEIWGTTFSGEYIDSTYLDRENYGISGDKAEAYYTEVLRKYKFMEFEGENFLSEASVWDKIASDGYKIRYFNKSIYFCQYLDDGLTNAGVEIYKRNPKGTAYVLKQKEEIYKYSKFKKIINYYQYYNMTKDGLNIETIANYLDISTFTLRSIILVAKVKQQLKKLNTPILR